MSAYDALCLITALAVFISLINHYFGKFQTTIAITGWSLAISATLLFLNYTGLVPLEKEQKLIDMLQSIQFDDFLLKGVLGFLLFGGALNIDLSHLRDQKFEIPCLAFCATLISTFFIGGTLWYIFSLVGLQIDFIYCCLFGALISPTDPIAVLAIVKKLNAPQRISTQIEGESLFNDGLGLVVFSTIFTIAFGHSAPTFGGVASLFIHEAIGGIVFGAVLGFVFHYLIKKTHDSMMRMILTILIPTAGYVIGEHLDVSAPLAMVVSGIMIGNFTKPGLSDVESHQLSHLWELIDEILNAVLFLLIGLIMLTFTFHYIDLVAALIAIPLVLLSRYISVKACYIGFNRFRSYNPESVKILTWGGLRGGLALAMAMAIPVGVSSDYAQHVDIREIIVVMTYAVVVFSILVQASTITPMIQKAKAWEQAREPKSENRAKAWQEQNSKAQ
ncbi:sodium/proton antiporter, CPA1 family [Vibrio xiamenensis]|uniref:Sodium/proton antiporter, CPA1 family n=1 Tax=Vibrio xiamenensis TaxID=861298 RepID=A0A1G7WUB2_9VIBR|nr:sodium:proton antiporter [Vibrio xiamenensis]SDG75532.1 sodium/proton antiporter, CPA1 family [Vibrio xiamenensis]